MKQEPTERREDGRRGPQAQYISQKRCNLPGTQSPSNGEDMSVKLRTESQFTPLLLLLTWGCGLVHGGVVTAHLFINAIFMHATKRLVSMAHLIRRWPLECKVPGSTP